MLFGEVKENSSVALLSSTCFETKSKRELMMHIDIEHDLSCVFCDYKAITMLGLKEHKINNH